MADEVGAAGTHKDGQDEHETLLGVYLRALEAAEPDSLARAAFNRIQGDGFGLPVLQGMIKLRQERVELEAVAQAA